MSKITIEKSKFKILVDEIRTLKEYINDFKQYKKFSMYMEKNITNYDYLLLIKAHSIEKGMSMKEIRPFGQKKIDSLYKTMCEYDSLFIEKSFGYKNAEAIILEWIDIFEKNEWNNDKTYIKIKEKFRDKYSNFKCGKKIINIKDLKQENFEQLCLTRYSVRTYRKKDITDEDIKYCINLANKTPSACNRQMCKVYQIKKESNKKALYDIHLGLSGFDKDNTNYFLITYDISAFNYYGERNQGFFNAGLFAMNFVYALQSKKIGSCFLQWNASYKEEKTFKEKLNIPKNEKIVVVIGAGYIEEKFSVPYSNRRNFEDIFIKR